MVHKKPSRRHFSAHGEPPNPLDFPIKDPLRETYEGRWKQLPVLHKVGLAIVFAFWILFVVSIVWTEGGGLHLIGFLPLVAVTAILIAFLFVLGRNVD